jgi:hypothetical protein
MNVWLFLNYSVQIFFINLLKIRVILRSWEFCGVLDVLEESFKWTHQSSKTTPNYSSKWNPNNENKSQHRNVRTEAVECEGNLI